MTHTVGRILWKDLRAQRALFLTLVGGGVVIQVLLVAFHPWDLRPAPGDLGSMTLRAAFILACCFGAGATAVLFAGEQESNTIGFLQRIPLKWRDVLIGKVVLALLGFVAVLALLLASGAAISWLAEPSHADVFRDVPRAAGNLARLAIFPFQLVAFVLLFSLLLGDVLKALLYGCAVTCLIPLLGLTFPSRMEWDTAVEIARFAILVVVASIDVALAPSWLRSPESPRLEGWLPKIKWRHDWSKAVPSRDILGLQRSPVAWRRSLSSQLWKEWCLARSFLLPAVLVFELGLILDPFFPSGSLTGCLALGWVLGTASYRGEQRDRTYRLLAHHGASPDGYWLSKHLVWLPMTLVIACLMALFNAGFPAVRGVLHFVYDAFNSGFLRELGLIGWLHQLPTLFDVIWGTLTAYAIAQLCSLLTPGVIPAAVAGLFGVAGMVILSRIAITHGLPFWLTFGPLPFILFAAGWLRTGDWLTQRNTRAGWCKIAAMLAIPACCLFAATITYRVVEIPEAAPPRALTPVAALPALRPGPPDAEQAFLKAVKAIRMPEPEAIKADRVGFRPAYAPWWEGPLEGSWDRRSDVEKKWVQDNQEPVKTAIQAARQAPRAPADDVDFAAAAHWERLITLLLYSARRFESQDKLDDALDCYLATVRLGDDLARFGTLRNWKDSEGVAVMALRWMTLWAANPKQSAERIKRAIENLQRITQVPPLSLTVERTWLFDRQAIVAGFHRQPEIAAIGSGLRIDETTGLHAVFPWERARLLRQVDFMYSQALRNAQAAERNLANRVFPPVDITTLVHSPIWDAAGLHQRAQRESTLVGPAVAPGGDRFASYIATTPAFDVVFDFGRSLFSLVFRGGPAELNAIAFRRMQLIALALYGRRLESHDPDFSSRLEKLVPAYFAKLPDDPWTGSAFHWFPSGTDQRFLFPPVAIAPREAVLEAGGPYVIETFDVPIENGGPKGQRLVPFEEELWGTSDRWHIAFGAPRIPLPAYGPKRHSPRERGQVSPADRSSPE